MSIVSYTDTLFTLSCFILWVDATNCALLAHVQASDNSTLAVAMQDSKEIISIIFLRS